MVEDDIVKFRLVVLNEDDTVKEVVFESKNYMPWSRSSKQISQDLYECLLDANLKYDFSNWKQVPTMEFQIKMMNGDIFQILSMIIWTFKHRKEMSIKYKRNII